MTPLSGSYHVEPHSLPLQCLVSGRSIIRGINIRLYDTRYNVCPHIVESQLLSSNHLVYTVNYSHDILPLTLSCFINSPAACELPCWPTRVYHINEPSGRGFKPIIFSRRVSAVLNNMEVAERNLMTTVHTTLSTVVRSR